MIYFGITRRFMMEELTTHSTPEAITEELKDDDKTKEYANYVILEGKSKRESWIMTFNPELPMPRAIEAKMYRWFQKDSVKKLMTKLNKSLEVDWIDKRVNALQHLFDIGTNSESSEKSQIDGLDKFLTHLNKVENKIVLETQGSNQINIIQVVQDRLATIVGGSTITPDGMIAKATGSNADNAIDAILVGNKVGR